MKAVVSAIVASLALVGGEAQALVIVQQSPNVTLADGQSYDGSIDLSSYLNKTPNGYELPSSLGVFVQGYSPLFAVKSSTFSVSYEVFDPQQTAVAIDQAFNTNYAIFTQANVALFNFYYNNPGLILGISTADVQAQEASIQQDLTTNGAYSAQDLQEISAFNQYFSSIVVDADQLADLAVLKQNVDLAGANVAATLAASISSSSPYAVFTTSTFTYPLSDDTGPDSLKLTSGGIEGNDPTSSIAQTADTTFAQVLQNNSEFAPYLQPGTSPTYSLDGTPTDGLSSFISDYGPLTAGGNFPGSDINLTTGIFNYTLTANTNSTIDVNDVKVGFDPAVPGSVSAVPEPGTWVMIILGFGLVGRVMRRRRDRSGRLIRSLDGSDARRQLNPLTNAS